MKECLTTRLKRIPAALSAAGLLAFAVGCGKGDAEGGARSIDDIRAEQGVPVALGSPVRTNLFSRLVLDGVVAPNERGYAMAQVDERVERVHVEEGDEVFAEQPRTLLVELDRTRLDAVLKAATTAYEDADTTLRRATELLKNGAVPQQDVDRAGVALNAAKANLIAARQDLAHTRVYAPINGFVAKRLAEPGMVTSKGQVLVEIVDVSRLRVRIEVPESRARWVRKGLGCHIRFDAYPEFDGLTAEIFAVNPALDPASRKLHAQCFVEKPAVRLLPGMHARVTVVKETRENVLAIPAVAVVASNGDRGVYVVGPDRTARFQPLTLGLTSDGWVEVRAGLEQDTVRIVVDGHKQLSDGARVDTMGK